MIRFDFDTRSVDDYERFLQIRRCPVYSFRGTSAFVPDEYAASLGVKIKRSRSAKYLPHVRLFDYQKDITAIAIEKRKYAVFADCGLGKTLIILDYARHVAQTTGGKVLIVSPLMVVRQTCEEYQRWYGDGLIGKVAAADLAYWLKSTDPLDSQIGITNYEAIRDGLPQGTLAGLILDESSMLKSHYGAWGTRLIEMGRGVEWKLCCTGTPAPNDRIEFANHAVFLDRAKTVNEFLASYFINRGETQNRWELKPHALKPFYRSLADWSIFLTNPATYGWNDNVGVTPPIHIHIDHIDLTPEQRKAAQALTGSLITNNIGGIGDRGKLSQIAKGKGDIPTLKPAFIRGLVDSWPDESTIIWCNYNDEQDRMEQLFPEAVSVSGSTPLAVRELYVDYFKGLICRCQMQQKLNQITQRNTIAKTNTDGTSEAKKSKPNTTRNDVSNTQAMSKSELQQGSKSKSGRRKIQRDDMVSDSGNTASQSNSTTRCSNSKTDCAQSAPDCHSGGFTLTTATIQEQLEGCCVKTATTELGNSKTTRTSSSEPQCTCDPSKGRILITKCKVLGFGLNLQVCTRQIFSGLKDSYEEFYQAVKRSNRIGSTRPLNVHIPVTELEVPFVDNVLRKADRVESDTREQEELFKEIGHACFSR